MTAPWVRAAAACLWSQSGQISPALDAARTAAAMVAAIQGGVTILMSTGSSQHLEAALDTTLLFLRDGTA